MKIIFGTASKQRRKVFETMGYDFEVMTADIDEKAIRSDSPEELTLALARAKAAALQKRITEPAILITADQVIVWQGEIREKPENAEQARIYLSTCHMAPSRIVNGIAITNTGTGAQVAMNDFATVAFKKIPEDVIAKLIQEGNVFSWAGGFAVDDPSIALYVESIEGEEGSVHGLPKALTEKLIREVQV